MQLRTWLYLKDVVKYGNKAIGFAGGKTDQEILDDEMAYLAIERCLFIVGEAVSAAAMLDAEVQDLLSDTGEIRKFRNLLAHGYFKVDRLVTIRILRESLPKLIREAAAVPEPAGVTLPPTLMGIRNVYATL